MSANPPAISHGDTRLFWAVNAAVSLGVIALLAWIFFVHRGPAGGGERLQSLPAVNAALNAMAAGLLVAGRTSIRRHSRALHAVLMTSAFAVSAIFFASYLAYHYTHGDTHFAGGGLLRTAYLVLLASHVLLSVGVVPLAVAALYHAYRGDFGRHVRVTRVLWPIWLYVSVTGVVIYLMLRGSYGGSLP